MTTDCAINKIKEEDLYGMICLISVIATSRAIVFSVLGAVAFDLRGLLTWINNTMA